MKISYAITVKDEIEEIKRLIPFLLEHKREEDEIVILWDNNGYSNVYDYLRDTFFSNKIEIRHSEFKGHFADWKNHLNSLCTKNNTIFSIDADELPTEFLIKHLHTILEQNPEIDLYLIPRINIVRGIGLNHVEKWGWNISKMMDYIEEKEFDLSNPQDLDEYNLLKKYNLIIEEIIC